MWRCAATRGIAALVLSVTPALGSFPEPIAGILRDMAVTDVPRSLAEGQVPRDKLVETVRDILAKHGVQTRTA